MKVEYFINNFRCKQRNDLEVTVRVHCNENSFGRYIFPNRFEKKTQTYPVLEMCTYQNKLFYITPLVWVSLNLSDIFRPIRMSHTCSYGRGRTCTLLILPVVPFCLSAPPSSSLWLSAQPKKCAPKTESRDRPGKNSGNNSAFSNGLSVSCKLKLLEDSLSSFIQF